jgi:hypothetical protein
MLSGQNYVEEFFRDGLFSFEQTFVIFLFITINFGTFELAILAIK